MQNTIDDFWISIYESAQNSRTTFSDALLMIVIFTFVSMIVIEISERITKRIILQKDCGEQVENGARLVFSMVRYIILLSAIYLVARAVIEKLTHIKNVRVHDMIMLLHSDTVTYFSYAVKILIALAIFVLFNTAQNIVFKIFKRWLNKTNINETFSKVILNIVRFAPLIFIITSTILQFIYTKGNNTLALVLYSLVAVAIAVPKKEIEELLRSSNETLKLAMTIAGWVTTAAILTGIGWGIYAGIDHFINSGGTEIALIADLSEEEIEVALNTIFEDDSVYNTASAGDNSGFSLRTDGEMSIVYMNNRKVGVNITGREYKLYGVSINQPEISAVNHMYFPYDYTLEATTDLQNGISRSHFYCNPDNNTCLVLTVNIYSNKVFSITYYSDFSAVKNSLGLDQ